MRTQLQAPTKRVVAARRVFDDSLDDQWRVLRGVLGELLFHSFFDGGGGGSGWEGLSAQAVRRVAGGGVV